MKKGKEDLFAPYVEKMKGELARQYEQEEFVDKLSDVNEEVKYKWIAEQTYHPPDPISPYRPLRDIIADLKEDGAMETYSRTEEGITTVWGFWPGRFSVERFYSSQESEDEIFSTFIALEEYQCDATYEAHTPPMFKRNEILKPDNVPSTDTNLLGQEEV